MTIDRRPYRADAGNQDRDILSHGRRVAALAMEISRMAGFSGALQLTLEEAALSHHALDLSLHPTPLARLAWNVVCGGDGSRRSQEELQAVAGIVRLCNLVDEQFEALQFDYKETDTILDEVQSFAPFEGFDPALVEHFRRMRYRGLMRQIQRGGGLPVESSVARHVFRTLGQDRLYEVSELAAAAVGDPVLAASLIRVANSSLYYSAHRFSGVVQAICYIGTVESRRVMLAAVLRPLFASAGLTRLWSHSVGAAQLCSALATQTEVVGAEDGLLLGLVHDFGRLAVQFAPRETNELYARLMERGCPPAYVEHLLFGCDHGEIGAGILSEWNFSPHLIDAVRFHHQPERSDSGLAAFTYLVEFWSGLDEDLPSLSRVTDCLRRTGLSWEALTQAGTKDKVLNTLAATA